MDVLWDADGALTPAEVQGRLTDDRALAYTTVKTVLDRLTRKGRLIRSRSGRPFTYTPIRSRIEHTALTMEQILESGRDRTTTLAHFLGTLSASERTRIRDMLDQD